MAVLKSVRFLAVKEPDNNGTARVLMSDQGGEVEIASTPNPAWAEYIAVACEEHNDGRQEKEPSPGVEPRVDVGTKFTELYGHNPIPEDTETPALVIATMILADRLESFRATVVELVNQWYKSMQTPQESPRSSER